MRTLASVLAALLLASQVSASLTACNPLKDYKTMMTSFMQGFQANTTETDTDCYEEAEVWANRAENFFNTFKDFDFNDAFAPFYAASELTVAFVEVTDNCQTTNFAKQLAVRFNSLGGMFEFVSEFGVAALR